MPLPKPQAQWSIIAIAAAATLALQFALVSWTFPITALFSDQPLFYIDGAYHWHQIHVARELGLQGKLTGYDPYFAAGHMGGVTLNASAKIPALIAIVLGGQLTEIQIYKLFVFAAAVVGPGLVPIAAGLSGVDARSTWISAALGLCAWWASAFRWYHTAGMVSFVLACFLSLPYVALLIRSVYDSATSARQIVILGVLGAFGLLLHPLFPILVGLVTLTHLIADWRRIAWGRAVVVLGAVSLFSLVPNLPWVLGMLLADPSLAVILPYQTRVDITMIPREMLGQWRADSMGAKLYLGLIVASVVAAVGAASVADRHFARTSLSAWAFIAVFAALGAAIPGVSAVQPNRFSSAAYLFLVLPAAIGTGVLISGLWSRAWRTRALAVGLGGVCTASFAWSAIEVAREVSSAPIGHYGQLPPEVRALGDKSKWLVTWLSSNTTADGRILFETSKARIHDQAHMAGYYAVTANREFIGGPYPFMFNVSFWDAFAFGQPINSLPQGEFHGYLDLYNIGWIVAHTSTSKQYMASLPTVVQVAEHDDLRIYKVEGPLSYFLVGSGRVQDRGINRLLLTDLAGTEAVIKYHYVTGLTADPPAKVEPYWIPGVSQPFVRLTPISGRTIELRVR